MKSVNRKFSRPKQTANKAVEATPLRSVPHLERYATPHTSHEMEAFDTLSCPVRFRTGLVQPSLPLASSSERHTSDAFRSLRRHCEHSLSAAILPHTRRSSPPRRSTDSQRRSRPPFSLAHMGCTRSARTIYQSSRIPNLSTIWERLVIRMLDLPGLMLELPGLAGVSREIAQRRWRSFRQEGCRNH